MHARLGLALLTSLGIHLAIVATWAPSGANPTGGLDSTQVGVENAIKVALAPSRKDVPAGGGFTPTETQVSIQRPTDPRESTRAAEPKPERSARAGSGTLPRVVVTDAVARARLGEYIGQFMTRTFPIEIEEPVRIRSPLTARFPPAALLERREDTVVVWVIVREDGTVDEIHAVEGTPEFVDAVSAVVAPARFRPAKSGGHAIRFPIALEFAFRIAPTDPNVGTTGIAAAR